MAETVGSSFCRGVGVCEHSNMQIILILQVLILQRKMVEHLFPTCLLNARSCRKCGTGVSLYKIDFCTFQVFRGDQGQFTSPLYKMDLSIFEGLLCSRQPFCLCVLMPGSPLCRASGSYNPKNAPKKSGLGALILQRKHLATCLAGSSFCKGLRPQKPDLALQNGNTQPPQCNIWGYSIYIYGVYRDISRERFRWIGGCIDGKPNIIILDN